MKLRKARSLCFGLAALSGYGWALYIGHRIPWPKNAWQILLEIATLNIVCTAVMYVAIGIIIVVTKKGKW